MAAKKKTKAKSRRTTSTKRGLKARRSVGGLKTWAKKLIGKTVGNVVIQRVVIPEGQTKKDAAALRKAVAGVPWSGKKGTVMLYGRQIHESGASEPVTFTNPFRKGKVRKTTRRIGQIFKRKGRRYIVTRLRNGVKVARPWASRIRRK